MTKMKPSSPKLMSSVLEAVTSLGMSRGRGIFKREILDFVKKTGNVGTRNLTVQVHRALKHGVNAGILKFCNGRYKADYSVIAPLASRQIKSKSGLEQFGKNNKNRVAKMMKVDEDENSVKSDNEFSRNEKIEILKENKHVTRSKHPRPTKEKCPPSRESHNNLPSVEPPIEKSPIDSEKSRNQNFTSSSDKKKDTYRQDFANRRKSKNFVKRVGTTSKKRGMKNYVSSFCNRYTGVLAIPCMVLAKPWCVVCLKLLKNYIDNCIGQDDSQSSWTLW